MHIIQNLVYNDRMVNTMPPVIININCLFNVDYRGKLQNSTYENQHEMKVKLKNVYMHLFQ